MNLEYIKNLRTILSESTDFQSWVGVANATLALPFIIFHRQDVPEKSILKFVIIKTVKEGFDRVATGEGSGAFENDFDCDCTFYERFADEKDDWTIARTDDFFANVRLFINHFLDNSQKTSPVPLIVIDRMNEETDGNLTMMFQAEQDSGDVDKKGYFNTWIIGRTR